LADIPGVGFVLGPVDGEVGAPVAATPGHGQFDVMGVDGAQTPDAGGRSVAEECPWADAQQRSEEPTAVDDLSVADRVNPR
jgi:hypothetical protein